MAEQEYADEENPDVPPGQEKVGIANLEAENARLQARVEELEVEREEHRQYAQDYKALSEQTGEHVARLEAAVEAAVEDLEDVEAQSGRRREALKAAVGCIEGLNDGSGATAQVLADARAAIGISPEEAREKRR